MDVDELVTALNGIDGVRAATKEATLRLPGVWVRPIGLRRDVLSGEWTRTVQLRLLANKSDPGRELADLDDLFAKVTTVLQPDGDPQYATVTRPSSNAAVPALVFPLDLLP